MKENTFGAFEALIGELSGPDLGSGGREDFPIQDPPKEEGTPDEEKEDLLNTPEEEIDTEKIDTSTKKQEEVSTEEEIDTDETEKIDTDEKSVESNLDLGEFESDITKYVQEKLYEKLGWEFNEEEDKFDKVEDIVEYLEKIVEANSTPNFANKELKELNEFVQNGGDLKSYFDNIYGEFDIDNIDISRESNQEIVVREQLKELGLSKEAINKRIQRYTDTGILEEEATEAYDYLKNNKETKQKRLLEEQQNIKQEYVKQQQKLYEDVSSTIDKLDNAYGKKISTAEKKKLKEYILKVESDGKTKYQKDYSKSLDNLVLSAFATMKGDNFTKDLTRQAESQATKTLRNKLATKTKLGKDSSDGAQHTSGNNDDMLSSFNRLFKP